MSARPWLALYEEHLPADIEPEHPDLLSAFRAAVARAGDQPLLRYFDTPLSGREVDALSDALAVGLAELGVGRGERVALYLQNVPQYVISLLAIWKLGAIAVACNPMLKRRELARQLQDSGAVAVIALEVLHATVVADVVAGSSVRATVVCSELDFLDGPLPASLAAARRVPTTGTHDFMALLERHRGERPAPVVLTSDAVAVLSYTSGTTGPPKGAMNTHGNLVHSAQVLRDWARLEPEDSALGAAPLFHVTGLAANVAVALTVPMQLVLGHRFDAAEAARLIEAHRVTFLIGTSTMYIALMEEADRAGRDLSSVAKAFSGGAPTPAALIDRWEAITGSPLHNAYGLTETTAPTHLTPLGRPAPVDPDSGALAVGVPVFNTRARIVDPDGRTLAPGELGEIAIAGPQVVPGYWGRPDATAHAQPGGELRSGDIGKVDADGWFYVVDRLKDLIIASGFKVWPRDVEDVLYEHPAVREAAVVGVPDAYRGETVKAFVCLRDGADVGAQELIDFCRARLAAYKYPRAVEIVGELPKTVSGKILRRELRDRDGDADAKPTSKERPA